MRRIIKAAAFLAVIMAGGSSPLLAGDLIPDRHISVTRNLDFYGSDLQALFDTSFQACERACLLDTRCKAFTFNTQKNACFPKSAVSETKPYDGALSARVHETPPEVQKRAVVRASELSFLTQADFAAARALAEKLPSYHYAGEWSADALLQAAAERRKSGQLLDALKFTGAALTLTDAPDQWTEYARLALTVKLQKSSNQRHLRGRALPAAVNAYLRSASKGQRVAALQVMARALEQANRGRVMIPALRLAQSISPRDETAKALDRAIGKYGFRVVEDTVESDLEVPRICAQFSEPLVQVGVDYAPYVKLPAADLPVEVSGNQLCIGGLDHGQRYALTLRRGLPAASGEKLSKPVTLTHYVRDRSPSVRFAGRAYVLPKGAGAAIPVETVNLRQLDLVLRRLSDRNLLRAIQEDYFGRPLSYWQAQNFGSNIAEVVWRGTGEVKQDLNREVTTRLPMGDIIAGLPAGIYALQARVPGADDYDNPAAMQWFVLSDLGLASMSGADGVHVFVRALSDATPKAGIKVTLLSRANAILAETETDAQGYAHFAAGLTKGRGGAAPALITAQQGQGDLGFLPLTDPAFDLSDRGVAGRAPAGAVDTFVTTDRGAYRVGEVVHVTALARDARSQAIAGLPLTAILRRPDGVEYSRQLSKDLGAGGYVLAFPIGNTAPRGTWRLSLYTDPEAEAIASTKFLVEDFLPERLDFTLALPKTPIHADDTPLLKVQADYLFGAPAADLPIEGEVLLRARDGLEAWPGYRFGRYDQPFTAQGRPLPDGLTTDDKGAAQVPVTFPDLDQTPDRPLEARLTVRVSEGSGRPVERRVTVPLAPAGAMIGIKPLFKDVVPEGSEAAFSILAVDRNETATAMTVKWTVDRVRTRYQWYQQNGNWNWEPITTRSRVKSGTVKLTGAPVTVTTPVGWGRYEIKVEREGGVYLAASQDFYAGWYAPADASATPDMLELSLDKPAYKEGDTATLRLVPRYAGKALVSVMSNHLIDMKAVDVKKGENLITLPVTGDWGAGAYVTATVIRPMDVAAGHNPARALGLAYAPVDPGMRKLSAGFDIGAEAAPRAPFDVALRVEGVQPGETAHATIAVVDLGILNLTGFKSPDPDGHYFGQRRLGMELRDVYGRLIDGLNGAMGSVRSGGDAEQASSGTPSVPPMKKLVSFFSGPLTVGADGMAHTTFDLPDFNGTLRLMAVVWTSSAVGQASRDVLVRDPVVVSASLPRFLAPGDSSRLRLEIIHAYGPTGRMGLDVSAEGLKLSGAIPTGVTLAKHQKTVISVPITAENTGVGSLRVALTTPDGHQLVQTLTLPVKVNDPAVTRVSRFTLAAGKTFAFSRDVFAGLRPGSGSVTLAAGPLARLDAPGLLNALDRYPYGCTEQVTSKALPLLYLNDVARAMGLTQRKSIQKRVDQAIEKVLTNQSTNGAFGLWQPDEGDMWLDAYVSDFLSRARAKGYAVPDTAFRMAMDNLRNQVNYAGDFDSGGQDLAYALMVLAREGAAATGDLRYYADVKGDAFSTPLAAAQLGAALAYYGDKTRSDAMFARAGAMIAQRANLREGQLWRADYGTRLRDAAGVLALAVETGSTAVDTGALTRMIAPRNAVLERSTQEAAWTLLAAKSLVTDPTLAGFTINGAPVKGPLVRLFEDDTTLAPMAIQNGTGKDQTLTLTTFGVPVQPEPAGGNGYAIKRQYFTLKGDPADLNGVKAGTRLVVVLTVSPYSKSQARLMVADPLPAGFEIDNPHLLASGEVRALDWLNLADIAKNTEFRSDRFLAAVDWGSDQPFQLAYMVRAISPGRYHHPAASVEDMYRPAYRAHSDPGQLTVSP